jgi:hypothetical protein
MEILDIVKVSRIIKEIAPLSQLKIIQIEISLIIYTQHDENTSPSKYVIQRNFNAKNDILLMI